jgi:alkylation response protein AidB-like acyl-CoA dehydrogenase
MDTRHTSEQAELRRSARQLARELSASTVADLGDATRAKRLAAAVRDAGWLELRDDAGDGSPLGGGVEAAIVADALGGAVADVAFAGPVLAADLARRAGAIAHDGTVVAFSDALVEPAIVAAPATPTPTYAVDASDESSTAFVVVGDGSNYRLGRIAVDGRRGGADLTRGVHVVPSGAAVEDVDQNRPLRADDLAAWTALGLALTSADLVGVMRGALDVTVAYARERRRYGVSIGSFQAVQHLLAEARCLMEGSYSAALYASWAVDNVRPDQALAAGRVAKAYSARAARTVCETAIQVHGGIGNTWDCVAHVYLRRALLSANWFGDDGVHLHELARQRVGASDGLS